MKNLFGIRRDFKLRMLDESEMLVDPIQMFEKWFEEILRADVLEPNAMCLSTSTGEGKPSSRILLLKQIQSDGFVFFTNYDSRKSQQIAGNEYGAINFLWRELERQVSIEGKIEKISSEESDAYFEVRPRESKIGAWVSPQSQVIPDRQYLDEMVTDAQSRFPDDNIPRPNHWGGYILKPFALEFWQGRENRLHDRIKYTLMNDATWKIERLAP